MALGVHLVCVKATSQNGFEIFTQKGVRSFVARALFPWFNVHKQESLSKFNDALAFSFLLRALAQPLRVKVVHGDPKAAKEGGGLPGTTPCFNDCNGLFVHLPWPFPQWPHRFEAPILSFKHRPRN